MWVLETSSTLFSILSTLEFTVEGDLILRDVNTTSPVWSTNTTGRSVIHLEVTETGNLMLINANNKIIWQSFDHPTDTLVLGQKLVAGQKYVASESTTTWNEGSQYLCVTSEGLIAFIDSDPPLSYFRYIVLETSYVEFLNGSLSLYVNNGKSAKPMRQIPIPPISSNLQYIKLDSDGHLKVYAWASKWQQVHDIFLDSVDDCHYPLACGKYGICSNSQCTCPYYSETTITYFQPVDQRHPNLGCTTAFTPQSCDEYHKILSFNDITCFNLGNNVLNTDLESCKQACLMNCSCKESFFSYNDTESLGQCYMESELFSLINYESQINHWSVHIKVQTGPISDDGSAEYINRVLLKISLGTSFAVLLITLVTVCLVRKRNVVDKYDSCLDFLSGTPMRFSYEELKTATENFSRKLGEGGFGSVYKGTLINGTKIAVKRLDRLGHVKQSFLAEVETIGRIHHVNLVKLIGFCADKSHKLLVYEFMCNGSLEKWIFSRKNEVEKMK